MGIPHLGMVGWAFRPNCFSLTVDPASPAFADAVAAGAVPRQVTHELAHCLRSAAIGSNHNLGDALVSEGLCGHFTHQCLGTPPEAWESGLDADGLATWTARAQAEAEAPRYDHQAWFLGRGAGAPPCWAGYSIGFDLVGRYLARKPGTRASDLFGLHAGRLLREVWPTKTADI